ncbi:MAG TPA: uroporphyrinogen-III synthase [Ignavibacteriaceae bacterium]|nr:uroporphyrinogen-III synthase [Ignavibacteriaceae bacterium]
MLIKEKKDIRKQRKREKILDAAAELFSHKSYHEVMMEDVAKLTSVAKGTVYNYFESKEELYFSIMRIRMENLISSLKTKIETEDNDIDSLRSFVTHLYMFMMKYQNFFMIYQKDSLSKDNPNCEQLVSLEAQLNRIIRDIIKSGKTAGLFRNVDEEFAISLILGSIYGVVQKDIEKKINDDEKRKEREKVFEFIVHGLYAGFKSIPSLPLKGKTIVITRTVEQSKESAAALNKLGADVIVIPTLEIVPPSSWREFDTLVSHPDKIDFIIFSSAHAVKMFSIRINELNLSFNFNRVKIVAIGNKTSTVCERHHIPVHIIPKKFSSEGVFEELSKFNLKNKVILIPRSAIGREELPGGLKDLGAIIKPVPVYNVSLPGKETTKQNIHLLLEAKPDLFIFTSPSTFDNFIQIMKISDPSKYFNGFDVAAIGPTTQTEIVKHNVKVSIMPDEFTIEGLIKKIVQYYSSNEINR